LSEEVRQIKNMPLQATHIKFALELKDFFRVEDLGKYIAGAVYPDSRYFTKIDRLLTHSKDSVDRRFFARNDFRQGWVSHIITDKSYYQEVKIKFPEESKPEDEKWYALNTAIKIVNDLKCAGNLDMAYFLKFFDLIEPANNENEKLMQKHISALKDLYGKKSLSIDDYAKMLAAAGIEKFIIGEIAANCQKILADKDAMEKINDLFDNKVMSRIRADWLPRLVE
jgi:hypothetical protein